jgi:hypothetical protein
MEGKKNKVRDKVQCACCGFFTIKEIKETCPVCFWEEDFYQQENIDDDSGPNLISLRNARLNFLKFRVIDLKYKEFVRNPLDCERKQY